MIKNGLRLLSDTPLKIGNTITTSSKSNSGINILYKHTFKSNHRRRKLK